MEVSHSLHLFETVESITDEAIQFIRGIESDEIFVGFSGGKDSIVTAKLMELSGVPYKLFYSFTGLDAPEVIRFIRKHYPDCQFLMPRRTFWRDLEVNVPPSDRLRWCCTLLKKEASWKLPHTERVLGIRAEESSRRANRGRINCIEKIGHTQYYPIFAWKGWQIWEFIEHHNLPYPKLYDWGFDRIGCVVCPYHSEKTGKMHQMYRDRWPKFFERWEKGIRELWQKRVNQGKQMFHNTADEFLQAWYLDDASRWYGRGVQQVLNENEHPQKVKSLNLQYEQGEDG